MTFHFRRRSLLAAAASCALHTPRAARADEGLKLASVVWPDGGNYYGPGVDRIVAYSGGFERMLPHRTVRAGGNPSPIVRATHPVELRYTWQGQSRSVEDYLQRSAVTGLIVARAGTIWIERYRQDRQPEMRMTGWSMSKSVTSLLLGIALQRGLIASIDEPAARYDDSLTDTLHGRCTLRQLMNMCSGARVSHDADNGRTIYPQGLFARSSDLGSVVRRWNWKGDAPGERFNYNELAPLTLGMVIRRTAGMSLSEFAQSQLWQAMGAEADASWQCDSTGAEFNCIGFAARLRDWLRLGLLVASQGVVEGRSVVDRAWFDELGRWRDDEAPVRLGKPHALAGYKGLFWHAAADGSRPYFNGHHGQRVFVDIPTRTVVVHTAVEHPGDQAGELFALFLAAAAAAG